MKMRPLGYLIAWVATFAAVPAWPADVQTVDGHDDDAAVIEVQELVGEISHLNLLRGLNLSKEQLDKLIPLAEEAVRLEKEKWAETASSQEYIDVSKQLIEALYTSAGPSEELRRRANALHGEKDAIPSQRMLERIGGLEEQARAVLTDAQIAIIEQFQPCYNPPQYLRDPVAVGQASTTETLERELNLIRRMPEELYEKRRSAIIDALIQRNEKERGVFPDETRTTIYKSFSQKLREMRRLSPVDFELKKGEYVKAFRLFDETRTYASEKYRYTGKVKLYMLNRRMLNAMKKWRAAMPAHGYETQAPAQPDRDYHAVQVEFLDNYTEIVKHAVNEHCGSLQVITEPERQQCA